jgi:hypothetical protein
LNAKKGQKKAEKPKKAKKAKKGRFCSCFGDSNPPREFEDEIYSEICSNNHSGKD